MKINLLTTKDGHVKGWDIIPENEDEKLVLGSIRNHTFFGIKDLGTAPKYRGCETEDNYVVKLKYRIPKYEKED